MSEGSTACAACGAALESCLVCESCGTLQELAGPCDPFEAFGFQRAHDLDPAVLGKRLLKLTRRLHPDFFAAESPEARALAERNSSELNAAHEQLEDPARRAELLVRLGGGPGQDEERQMPQAFLMEVLEWNEQLEAARESEVGSPERAALDGLRAELDAQRQGSMQAIARALDPLPARGDARYAEVRRHLNAIRYTDRALGEIDELGLARAARG